MCRRGKDEDTVKSLDSSNTGIPQMMLALEWAPEIIIRKSAKGLSAIGIRADRPNSHDDLRKDSESTDDHWGSKQEV